MPLGGAVRFLEDGTHQALTARQPGAPSTNEVKARLLCQARNFFGASQRHSPRKELEALVTRSGDGRNASNRFLSNHRADPVGVKPSVYPPKQSDRIDIFKQQRDVNQVERDRRQIYLQHVTFDRCRPWKRTRGAPQTGRSSPCAIRSPRQGFLTKDLLRCRSCSARRMPAFSRGAHRRVEISPEIVRVLDADTQS